MITAIVRDDGHGHGGYDSLELQDAAWNALGWPELRAGLVLRLRYDDVEASRRVVLVVEWRHAIKRLVVQATGLQAGTTLEVLSAVLPDPPKPPTMIDLLLRGRLS